MQDIKGTIGYSKDTLGGIDTFTRVVYFVKEDENTTRKYNNTIHENIIIE